MKTIYSWIYLAICGLYAIDRRIAIKTVHHVIMNVLNVAQDNTGSNNILNFL